MRHLPAIAIILTLAACRNDSPPPPDNREVAEVDAEGPTKGVDRSHAGKPFPDVTIKNPEDGDMSMAAFAGVPTLVNLWASWCAPCIKELPTLDALAKRHLVDGALGVVAISQDSAPKASVEAFLKHHKIANLGAFRDPDMQLSAKLGAQILPTTILYDAQGKEVWRYVGDLDWTSAEAARLLAEGGKPASE